MNRLLVVTVLFTLLALGAESFRLPRQVEEEEEQEGTLSVITGTLKSYYNSAVNTASGYVKNIKDMQLDKQAIKAYEDTTSAAKIYFGIMQDQLYHFFLPQN
ncbi:apolipoprotein C-II [Thalassophryne amazonica]|uniref:apolipoprotein C-II n=1 Tax=Thalassophryne amazonica TaxID=390379 RepID=UPI0014711653|nr:apolipoprotein C-II [Thalassophryne amazonica]XP_034029417.1 apolipoprotein C-II [Thalassophryne amazonica]